MMMCRGVVGRRRPSDEDEDIIMMMKRQSQLLLLLLLCHLCFFLLGVRLESPSFFFGAPKCTV